MIARFLLLGLCCTGFTQAAEPAVLVTAFAPFAGRGVNGSTTLARALERQGIPELRIAVEVLPVAWGAPERILPAAMERIRPVMVLGLGEGFPERIVCERIARNRAAGTDTLGHPPPAPYLLAMGPLERHATLPFDATWFTDLAVPMTTGDDAGTYLCNSLLYSALGTGSAPTGFVHVPPQGDMAEDAYAARHLPAIVRLVVSARGVPAARR